MSLVVDTEEYNRLFSNGRGVPAQSPLPPGIFGYDPDYVNPYRLVDLERARGLMKRSRLRGWHRSRNRQAADSHLRHAGYECPGPPAFRVLHTRVAAARHRCGDRRPPTTTNSRRRCATAPIRSSCGAGWPTTRTPRTSSSCSGPTWRARPRAAEYGELQAPALRRALSRDEIEAQRRGADGLIREMIDILAARAALDRAQPCRGLRALPRLALEREALRHVVPHREVSRSRCRRAHAPA